MTITNSYFSVFREILVDIMSFILMSRDEEDGEASILLF